MATQTQTPEPDRITKKAPWGAGIILYCVNKPSKRWVTKNIDNIGARSIQCLDPDDCFCKISDLRVALDNDPSAPDVPA